MRRFGRRSSRNEWPPHHLYRKSANREQAATGVDDELILLYMHSAMQSEQCAAKEAMQSVVYWTVGVAAALLAFFAVASTKIVLAPLAIRLGQVAWPVLTIFSGTYWLIEMGRMARSGVIARHIEVRLLAFHTSMDPRLLCQNAVRYGGPGHRPLEIRSHYMIVGMSALVASLYLQLRFPEDFAQMLSIHWSLGPRGWAVVSIITSLEMILLVTLGVVTLLRFRVGKGMGLVASDDEVRALRLKAGIPDIPAPRRH